ncbi:MAG: hypothetical protein ACI825_000241 [Planctomycetota bacterium]|jgi:hypothetical protein|uniref:hypothetical protein n=1 Tax=Patiriisocius sp. Uisw_047 TaxID=3230969 RepID=UPI0039EC9219
MKNIHSLFCGIILLFAGAMTAQNSYIVNDENLSLKTEVAGTLTLLWNTINGEYRYFSKKDSALIIELTNAKENGSYQNEFRQTLASQTSDAAIETSQLKFTLPSLRKFFNKYNTAADPSFNATAAPLKPALRLGAFAGITNSHFTDNPTNATQLQIGAELELIDRAKLKRHAMVLRLANTFESIDYNYSAFQASLNYRFKFVMQPKFDVYVNSKFVSYTSFNGEFVNEEAAAPEPVVTPTSGDSFAVPLTLGLGADIALGNGFITVHLDDLVGINATNNGEFPTNLQLGYKFEL